MRIITKNKVKNTKKGQVMPFLTVGIEEEEANQCSVGHIWRRRARTSL